jgi:preprotein translocase subunit SecG
LRTESSAQRPERTPNGSGIPLTNVVPVYTFLLILLIIDSVLLGLAILMQAGKGGGMAAAFGGASSSAEAFIGMRQAGNLLTRVTWWCGGIFIFLAFVLQVMSARTRVPTSVLDRPTAPATAPAPAPTGPAPAVPLEPAPQQGAEPDAATEAPPPQP